MSETQSVDKHEQPSHSRRWIRALCVILLAATLLNYANRFVFTQNAETIVDELFEGKQEPYGKLAGWFGFGFAFGGLLFGFLADVVSVRILYPTVVIVWSIAGLSTGLMESFGGMACCRFVLGLFEAGHWPCALRTTQRAFKPDQRTMGNSILQSGASLGAVLAPQLILLIGTIEPGVWRWLLGADLAPQLMLLLSAIDPGIWRWSFFIVGGLGAPWAIAWLWNVSESDVRKPVIQTDEESAGVGVEKEMQEIPFHRIFLTRRWYILLIVVICINTLWHYVRVWMPLMLGKDHNYSNELIQNFTSLYYLSTFFGCLASGALASALARRNWNVHRARLAVFLAFGLLASLSIPAAFMPRGSLLLGTLLLVGFGSLGLFPVYYSLNQEISARNQGKVGGSLGFSTWIILAYVHPWIGGLVDAHPEIRPYLFAAVGLGPLIGFLTLALCWGRRPTDV